MARQSNKRTPSEPAGLPEVEEQARAFQQARDARRDELADDYVELIDDMIAGSGAVRQIDIAARLGVAQPTVARMLKRLTEEGLVERHNARGVVLTQTGRDRARASRERGEPTVPSSIALERATNPFLRCDQDEVAANLEQQGRLQGDSAIEVFAAVRAWKDSF